MANGVKFGSYHSSTDLSLFLNAKNIGVPEVKEHRISIPAGDGSIDLTEFFGGVKYEDRELSFIFTKIGGNFNEVFTDIQNKLHGKKMDIILDTDTDYYYTGRVFVNKWTSNVTTGELDIKCICNPYKMMVLTSMYAETIGATGSIVIVCDNLRKAVIPTITISNSVVIDFGASSIALDAGVHLVTNIVLVEGANTLTFTGVEDTTIEIEYREGAI